MHDNEVMLSGLRGYIVFFLSLEKNWKKQINKKKVQKWAKMGKMCLYNL